jgi:hypothetical protein
MTAAEMSALLGDLLSKVSDGTIDVDVDSVPLASVDAKSRNLEVQIVPLLRGERGTRSIAWQGGPLDLWRSRKVPAELARRGWRLTLYDGTEELLVMGRGTSALTGHIHLHPAALWKLRKLV